MYVQLVRTFTNEDKLLLPVQALSLQRGRAWKEGVPYMSTALPKVTKRNQNYSRVVVGLAVVALVLAVVVGYLIVSQVLNPGQPATMADRDIGILQAQLLKTPHDPAILAQLAVLEYQKGRKSDALQHGALAVKYAGTTANIRLQYAGLLLLEHRPAEAKTLAQAEIDLPSTTSEADAYLIMAQAQRDLKDQKGALASMVAALRRNPYAGDARILYADMLLQAGQKTKAIQQYQAALLFLPNDPHALDALKKLGVNGSTSTTATPAHQSKPATTTKTSK